MRCSSMDPQIYQTNSVQLLVFFGYSFTGKLNKGMLLGTPLDRTCTDEGIFTNMKRDCLGTSYKWHHMQFSV